MTHLMNNSEGLQAVGCVDLVPADDIEVALDASCAALRALELVRTLAADDERVSGRVSLAIAAVRHAIADLREQQAGGRGAAFQGFVYGARIDVPARRIQASKSTI